MTKGKVDQSTEESLTGHTLLKSISFKGNSGLKFTHAKCEWFGEGCQ